MTVLGKVVLVVAILAIAAAMFAIGAAIGEAVMLGDWLFALFFVAIFIMALVGIDAGLVSVLRRAGNGR